MPLRYAERPFEVKEVRGDWSFSGYGSVFGVTDSYGDVVEKGAFTASLEAKKATGETPAMLWQHRASDVIGQWTKVSEDDRGLYVEGRIFDTTQGTDVYKILKGGGIRGLSIGYSLPKGGGEWDPKTETFRVRQVDLWEVSLVTFPANPAATVESIKEAITTERDFERFLREAGLSRSQAKGVIARGYEGLRDLREAEGELSNKECVRSLTQIVKEYTK